MSFTLLHAPLWGTPSPFRLSPARIFDLDQIAGLVITILGLLLLYGSESETVSKASRKVWEASRNLFVSSRDTGE